MADAPAPERARTPGSTSSIGPPSRARSRTTTCYATPEREAKQLVKPELLARPGDLPARGRHRKTSSGPGHVGEQRQRIDIWEEFKSRASAADPSAGAADPVDGGAHAPRSLRRSRSATGFVRACSPAALLPAGQPLVSRPAGPAAGDRRRLLLRHAGEERRVRRRRSCFDNYARAIQKSRPVHHQPRDGHRRARSAACWSACRWPTSWPRAPAGARACYILLLVMPFWTSFLIRTYAWLIILGPNGGLAGSARGAHRREPTSRSSGRRSRCCSGWSTATCR